MIQIYPGTYRRAYPTTYRGRFLVPTFLGAFLLFQMEPMVGRYVLPWFGGGPMVWTTCMLFFQVLLVAGYAYAHWLGSLGSARRQAAVHMALLAVSLAFLPMDPREMLAREASSVDPAGRILLALAGSVSGPYLLLAATSPLLQRWFARSEPGKSPWGLYSLSNAGSFLALLTYPFLIEPFLGLRVQSRVWSALYVGFAVLCGWTAWSVRTAGQETAAVQPEGKRPAWITVLFWMALAACGSTLLLGTTNILCQNIGPIAFLWIAPLSVYLLSFVVAFAGDRWYPRSGMAMAAGILVPVCCLMAVGLHFAVRAEVGLYLVALFVTCLLCHGELARSRPAETYLTLFYLAVAAGGALGGVFVALVSPGVFTDFKEYPIGLAGACVLALAGWWGSGALNENAFAGLKVRVSLTLLVIGGCCGMATAASHSYQKALASWRNFYGILRVREYTGPLGRYRELSNGLITHGTEFMEAPRSQWPTSYFGPHSGVGIVMQALHKPDRRVGVIGLGAGTLAAWGRRGDTFRFYDINPDVITAANSWFRYLKDSPARSEVVLGDARVELEREWKAGRPQRFDVLAVDAFSGDSIPLHLLTAECGDLYRKHLAPGGVLLFHFSTWFLDLDPVLRGLARHLGWQATLFISGANASTGELGSGWVLISPEPPGPEIAAHAAPWNPSEPRPIIWTDDFASFWHILKL